MKVSLHHLLGTAAAVTAVAFVVALIVRHARHGFALYLGDVAWFTFLVGALFTVLLTLATIVQVARSRRSARPASR
jgi:energy-converting hydrogenase Eha subunit C